MHVVKYPSQEGFFIVKWATIPLVYNFFTNGMLMGWDGKNGLNKP